MAFVLLSLKSSSIAGRSYRTESPPISAVMCAHLTPRVGVGRCNDHLISQPLCVSSVSVDESGKR